MRYLTSPNLPDFAVKLVAITANKPALKEAFFAIGIDTVECYPCDTLARTIGTHPDALLHHLGGNRILLAEQGICDEEKLLFYGFELCYLLKKLEREYPFDCALNTARIGSVAFGNHRFTAPDLLQYFTYYSINQVQVAQGYAKCSTCIISEHAIATSDPSIRKAALAQGFDVLEVPPGDILLPGCDSGFIGGCCGLIDRGTLAFYGNARNLPYYSELAQFTQKHGVIIKSLCGDKPVTDIGSILPLGM